MAESPILLFCMLSVACGNYHSVIVTGDGEVYTCGSNDHGQLGHEKSRKKPGKYLFTLYLIHRSFLLSVPVKVTVM
jgi:alpha-tubulin suppressor-like RCC1 family protein